MSKTDSDSHHHLLVAVYDDHQAARRAVERLIDRDYPMDAISIMGRAESSGDDVLGIYYRDNGERMKDWATHGALWGGLWGALSAAAGLFVVPGLGSLLLIGPIVEMLVGGAAGAALTGGAMAGAAAISQAALALHRMGVPQSRLQAYHDALEQGRYVLLLRCGDDSEVTRWAAELGWPVPQQLDVYPYHP